MYDGTTTFKMEPFSNYRLEYLFMDYENGFIWFYITSWVKVKMTILQTYIKYLVNLHINMVVFNIHG